MFRGTATEQVSLVPRTVPELGQRPIGSMVFTGSSCDDRTVGWARLGWDDVITGGSIAISSDRPWETAAMLNEVLTETVIRPDRFVGKSSAARFFEQARTPPSWVFLEGLADAIENAFTVRLRDGSRFRAYTVADYGATPEQSARGWLESVSMLRRYSRRFEAVVLAAQ